MDCKKQCWEVDPIRELLARNMDHAALAVFSHLDFRSLRRCLWVCSAWRLLATRNLAKLDFAAKEEAHNLASAVRASVDCVASLRDRHTAMMWRFLASDDVACMSGEEVLSLTTDRIEATTRLHGRRKGTYFHHCYYIYMQGGQLMVKDTAATRASSDVSLHQARGALKATAGSVVEGRRILCAVFVDAADREEMRD